MSRAPPHTDSLFMLGSSAVPAVLAGYRLYQDAQRVNKLMKGDLSVLFWPRTATMPVDPVAMSAIWAGGTAFSNLFGESVYKHLSEGVHSILSAKQQVAGEARAVAGVARGDEKNAAHAHWVYVAGLVSAILCWLHYDGASEMRARTHRITRTQNSHTATDLQRIDEYMAYFPGKDAEHKALLKADDTYTAHPYYRADGVKDGPSYLDFSVPNARWSWERMFRNLLLGLAMRTGIRSGGQRLVPAFLCVLEVGGVFEVLCAALRMKGFFALRDALVRVQQSVMQILHGAPQKKTRK